MLQSIHPQNPFITLSHPLFKPCLTSLQKPTSIPSLSSSSSSFNFRSNSQQWQLLTIAAASSEEGPIELSPDIPSIFATNDDPTPIQVATSVLLTGAISVFLFRAVRRRAKRAKELRMRSSGAKSMKEEALDSLKTLGTISVESNASPSPAQALLGAVTAGVIAVILYKFTTTIEAALNRQAIADNYSARQITITVRTIINGICYLATFVFGINAVGLLLYSGQLALNSIFEGSAGSNGKTNDEKDSRSPESSSDNPTTLENKDTDQDS